MVSLAKLPYGKTHVAIASTQRFNCPATMAIETLETTSFCFSRNTKNQKVFHTTFKVFLDLWEEPILKVIDKTQPNFMPK
ncbi:hypothetical protein OUZ56_025336 [Daphnia magna]|uniref:Uncharacterized protein n=1 Tax=Daphnia magna TaxID=35525 RepID=A0ABQ9ZJJ2_9CRUS|nr:hypothetical protein OUZ56_025336 [Daphnia magna]